MFVSVDAESRHMVRVLFGLLLFYFMWPFRFTFDSVRNVFGFASKFSICKFILRLAVH